MTIGEEVFIKYCTKKELKYEIVSVSEERTPDFLVYLKTTCVVVEVKDLNDNDEDKHAITEYRIKGSAVWGKSKIGARIRNQIDSAKGQLRSTLKTLRPTILLLYDNRSGIIPNITEYEILIGMYGFEKRGILNGHIIQLHGSKQRMTSINKKYISYIGVIENCENIILYENYYANVKLNCDQLLEFGVKGYKVENDPGIVFAKWVEIK